jgi:Uncharacterized ACR, COG1430
VSTRVRLIVAAAIALISAIGIGVLAVRRFAGDARAGAPLDLRETAAVAPFGGYREVRIAIGAKCARVVVADTDDRREAGLRGAEDLGPYAGMLFVQSRDSDVAFTMSRRAVRSIGAAVPTASRSRPRPAPRPPSDWPRAHEERGDESREAGRVRSARR